MRSTTRSSRVWRWLSLPCRPHAERGKSISLGRLVVSIITPVLLLLLSLLLLFSFVVVMVWR